LISSALTGRVGGADRSATGGDADDDGAEGGLAGWAPVIHDFKIRSDVLPHAVQGGGAGDGGVAAPTGDAASATASSCFSHLRAVVSARPAPSISTVAMAADQRSAALTATADAAGGLHVWGGRGLSASSFSWNRVAHGGWPEVPGLPLAAAVNFPARPAGDCGAVPRSTRWSM